MQADDLNNVLEQTKSDDVPDFGGRYFDVSPITQHKFTCTYAAVELHVGAPVFVKMLRGAANEDPFAVSLYEKEVGLVDELTSLSPASPIVPIWQKGQWKGQRYFVQPRISGWSLDHAMRWQLPFGGRSVLQVAFQCLRVIEWLHAAGVIHGDISPDNILIRTHVAPPETPWVPERSSTTLVDFNSASRVGEAPESSRRVVLLKPAYAAPELAEGRPPSPQSDLYSLGIVLYEMLTGQRPYEAETIEDVMRATRAYVPTFPASLGVPELFGRFVCRLLSPQPAQRPASAAECLVELERFRALAAWLNGPELSGLTDSLGAELRPLSPGFGPPTVERNPPAESTAVAVFGTGPEAGAGASVPSIALGEPAPKRQETGAFTTVEVRRGTEEAAQVDFSVFGPATIRPGSQFILEVWAYLRSQREEMLGWASRQGRVIERGSRGPVRLPSRTEITLLLLLDGFEISSEDAQDTFFWHGDITNVPFIVGAPAELEPGTYPGQVKIMHDGLLFSRLVFDLAVGTGRADVTSLSVRRDRIQSAFASYAHEDEGEVLRCVQGIRASGIDVFLDALSLRAGDNWEQQLILNIRDRDVFYLFWSLAASRSPWVEREWRYALQEKGLDHIHPIPLNDPRTVPPPPELASRHFNDIILACLTSRKLIMEGT